MIDLPAWAELAPWVQGAFGGVGATLLWEAVLRPQREKRALATVLTEEINHNLQFAGIARSHIRTKPTTLPGDFSLSTLVFDSVADRIGMLPSLTAEIVLHYRRAHSMNDLRAGWEPCLRDYRAAKVSAPVQAAALKSELDSMLVAYRQGLDSLIKEASVLLPKIRRASIAWWQFRRRARKLTRLTQAEIDLDVARAALARESLGLDPSA